MAGVNLVKKLKDRRTGVTGPGRAEKKRGFSLDLSFLSNAASGPSLSSGDRIRALLFVVGVAGGYYTRVWVADYTRDLETKKRTEIAAIDRQIVTEKSKLDSFKGLAQEADAYDRQMLEMQRKLAIIESLGRNKNLAVRIVDFVVGEMPSNLWLKTISLDTKADSKIELSGAALSMQIVSEFMKRLEGAVFFPKWDLASTEKPDSRDEPAPPAAVTGSISGAPVAPVKSKETIPLDARTFKLNAKVVPL